MEENSSYYTTSIATLSLKFKRKSFFKKVQLSTRFYSQILKRVLVFIIGSTIYRLKTLQGTTGVYNYNYYSVKHNQRMRDW